MTVVLYPVLVMGGLGAVLSIVLLVAARRFAVRENPLVGAVEAALPGANCGGCGKAGCHAFAEAIVETRDATMFCPPGGKATSAKVASLLGMEASDREPPVAVVMCRGNREAASFVGKYEGVADCRAATFIDAGSKVCTYGCLGLGSCVRACAYDAIAIEDGIAVVHAAKCVACGACVNACPRGLIRMAPRDMRVFVGCGSHDVGRLIRSYCQIGCIGCKKCVKSCRFDAMRFDGNLAHVDHEKCTGCGACIADCPRHVIFGVGLPPEGVARAAGEQAAVVEGTKE